MGTRSLVNIKDDDGKTIVTLYRQYDGYPTGMGQDIKDALNGGDVELLNGFSGQKSPAAFNGIGCMAAYLIGALKHRLAEKVTPNPKLDKLIGKDDRNPIGNVYLYPPDTNDVGEEFVYTLQPDKKGTTVALQVEAYGKKIFKGSLKTFNPEKVEKKASNE